MEIHDSPLSSTRSHVEIGEIWSLFGLLVEAAANITNEPAGEDHKPHNDDGGLKKEKDVLFGTEVVRGGTFSTLQRG